MKNFNRLPHRSLVLFLLCGAFAQAAEKNGAGYTVTKDAFGPIGHPQAASTDFALAYSWGEPVAGGQILDSTYTVRSGFLAGGFGNGMSLYVLRQQIGFPSDRVYMQGALRVGIPFNAPVHITFSDQLDESRIPFGVQARVVRDHQGQPSNEAPLLHTSYDRQTQTLTIISSFSWTGNTLYDISLSTELINVDGLPLEQPEHVYFGTLLDPQTDNVSMDSNISDISGSNTFGSAPTASLRLPERTLSDFSVVLFNQDPIASPLRVDPATIERANAKALASGGPYREALSLQEVVAYDTRGAMVDRIAGVGQLTLTYGSPSSSSLWRSRALSLWALDEEHALWVKLPASRSSLSSLSFSAPITRFSVFALMGDASGNASNVFAFPVPWRPRGDRAGSGSGQTGTVAGGITFSNLPSECTLRIFTMAGDLVRELRHSDLNGSLGQETWDVKTTAGDPVASGVYVWQMESAQESQSSRLMVIR